MDSLFKLFDTYPALPIGMLVLLFVMAYLQRRGRCATGG